MPCRLLGGAVSLEDVTELLHGRGRSSATSVEDVGPVEYLRLRLIHRDHVEPGDVSGNRKVVPPLAELVTEVQHVARPEPVALEVVLHGRGLAGVPGDVDRAPPRLENGILRESSTETFLEHRGDLLVYPAAQVLLEVASGRKCRREGSGFKINIARWPRRATRGTASRSALLPEAPASSNQHPRSASKVNRQRPRS